MTHRNLAQFVANPLSSLLLVCMEIVPVLGLAPTTTSAPKTILTSTGGDSLDHGGTT